MTIFESYRQASLRDGETNEAFEEKMKRVRLAGAMPGNAHEEIPPGLEEVMIAQALRAKRFIEANRNNPIVKHVMQSKLARMRAKN